MPTVGDPTAITLNLKTCHDVILLVLLILKILTRVSGIVSRIS